MELDDDYKDADLKVYLSVTNSSDEIQKMYRFAFPFPDCLLS